MIKYAALLRGINVGGSKLIKMPELVRIFTSLGLKNVKTYIQSGNVLFDSAKTDSTALAKQIEKGIHQAVGFDVPVVLRTIRELEEIIERNPFKKVTAADAKLFVSFLVEKHKSQLAMPFLSAKKDCEFIHVTPREVFTVAYAIPAARPAEFMTLIEKEFGKAVTTRNWNTVVKIVALATVAG